MEGERDWVRHILPGSTLPIIFTHREALWGSWLSLEVPLWVTARQIKHLRSFSVWHLKTAGWIKQQLLSSETLYSPNLITLHFSQRLEDSVLISLLSSSKSPFLSVRGEFKFPRAAVVVAPGLQCKITTRPTRSQESFKNGNLIGSLESTVLMNKETALLSNLMAICCLCKPPLKAKRKKNKTYYCN